MVVIVRGVSMPSFKSLFYINKASICSFSVLKKIIKPTKSQCVGYGTLCSWTSPIKNIQMQCKVRTMASLSPRDPSSFSRPELAIIRHIDLEWDVNFESKTLSGSAQLDFDVLDNIEEVVLDSRELCVRSVRLGGAPLRYSLGAAVGDFGAPLTVALPAPAAAGDKLSIVVEYSSAGNASALQWLEPAQTAGRDQPFMYSQCQPIHARSILPCQDTPAVKFTYAAAVRAPAPLVALMSALRDGPAGAAPARFRQPVPVPAYLLAVAVGALEGQELGPRSTIWSERRWLAAAAREFAGTERALAAAAAAAGGYEWGRADLLLMPPAFPYGGMENPCLTFVTPTLLAGDRSLADVIVHELVHSWTGNLVTNRNFEHFWLNEGFTVFLERKVSAALIGGEAGRRARDFQSLLGLKELAETVSAALIGGEAGRRARDFKSLLGLKTLRETIKLLGEASPLTRLVVDLRGVHPDDAFSSVPYEKGSVFLRYLEDLFGEESFDKFMKDYIAHFRRRSIDTDDFRRYLGEYYAAHPRLPEVQWDLWLHAPGMPPVIPDFDTTMSKEIDEVVPLIVAEGAAPAAALARLGGFTVHQRITLLQELLERPPLPKDKMAQLDDALGLSSTQNKEITYRWLRMSVRSKDEARLPEVFAFVNEIGRMKYVRPIYRELYAWEEVRQRTIDNFLKNEAAMMHVSAYTLRKDLHLRTDSSTSMLN